MSVHIRLIALCIIAVVIAIFHALSRPIPDECKASQTKTKISHDNGPFENTLDVHDEATIEFFNQEQGGAARNRFKLTHQNRPASCRGVSVAASAPGDGSLLVVPIGLESHQQHFPRYK